MRTRNVARVLAVVSGLSCLGSTCNNTNTRVTIPNNDQTPPIIQVDNFPIGGTAIINPADPMSSDMVTGNQTVTVQSKPGPCGIPKVSITARARAMAMDRGAVRSFEIIVTDAMSPTPPIYDVKTTQDPDANNQANTALSILGVNGLGGAPLTLAFGTGTCPQNKKFHVNAKSNNFSGIVSTLDYDLVGTKIQPASGTCGCP